MSKPAKLALTLLVSGMACSCLAPPTPAQPPSLHVVRRHVPHGSRMPPVPATYDDRCVRSYPDESGYARYDFSCDWRAEADVSPPTAAGKATDPALHDDRCVRSHTDEHGLTRYDFSCSWRDAIVLETAARKEACEVRHGEWGKHGWMEFEGCAWPAKDAGKPCRDRDECESRVCLAPPSISRDRPTRGTCFECVGDCAFTGNVVENGVARAKLHAN